MKLDILVTLQSADNITFKTSDGNVLTRENETGCSTLWAGYYDGTIKEFVQVSFDNITAINGIKVQHLQGPWFKVKGYE